MTVITLSTLAQALGVPVVTDGVFEGTPWAGSRAAVRVDGAEVIVPAPVTVAITAGVPDVPINLEPNDGTWCWKVVVYTTRPAHRLTRYVTVPASGPVDFGALIDVDPTTFIATTEIVAAWELVSAEAAASAAAAASSASDADADRVTAGTSAFNAGASAAAAQGSEEAAQAARTGAETAQDAAEAAAIEAASVGIATDAAVATRVGSGPLTQAAIAARLKYIDFGDTAPASGVSVHTALSAAIDQAITEGRDLYIPEGRYYLPSVITKTLTGRLRIFGDGPTKSVFYGEPDEYMLDLKGTGLVAASTLNLTADVAAGATALLVSSTTGFAVGDWVNVQSNQIWNTTSGKNARYGELAQVNAIPNGTTLTLESRMRYAYTTANTARVSKVILASGLDISGLGFENNARRTGIMGALLVSEFFEPRITDVAGVGLDGPLLTVSACVDAFVSRVTGSDMADDEVNSRYGYVINIGGASRGTLVEDSSGTRVRHVVTTNASASAIIGGVPVRSIIRRCSGTASTNFIFSTHEEGDDTQFIDCIVYGTLDGGFEMRAPRSVIRNAVVKNTVGIGVIIRATAIDTVISDIGITDLANVNSVRGLAGIGIRIDALRTMLDGFKIERTGDSSIQIGSAGAGTADDVIIRSGKTIAPGGAGVNPHTIRLTGTSKGHLIENVFCDNTPNSGSTINATTAGTVTEVKVTNVRSKGTTGIPVRNIPFVDTVAAAVSGEYVSNTAVGRKASAISTSLTAYDTFVGITNTSIARTVTLPAASVTLAGHMMTVKDESGAAATNNITIARAGADTIEAGTSVTISTNYGIVRLYSDGVSKWFLG